MDVCNPKELKALLGRHGFRFTKQLGQNFLIQSWVPQRTAEASGAGPGIGVLEIGPGVGPLTIQLAQRAEKVAAVEVDKALRPILEETLAGYDNVKVIWEDILKLDISALCREKFPGLPVAACANLPYQITTPVITALLKAECFTSVTVMIQREVARRICAQPGTADYGAFTLLCRYYADSELLYDVPPDCFLPAPKVTSSVIRLKVRGKPPVPVRDPALFFRLVRAAFGQRRKTLLNALYADFNEMYDKDVLRGLICACNMTETIRGERLSFANFAELAQSIQEIGQK